MISCTYEVMILKKIISFIIIISICLLAIPFTVNAVNETVNNNILIGDVNVDGKIDIKDATSIQKYSVKIYEFSEPDSLVAADVNFDNKVNIQDVTCIQKYLVGYENYSHVGEIKENETTIPSTEPTTTEETNSTTDTTEPTTETTEPTVTTPTEATEATTTVTETTTTEPTTTEATKPSYWLPPVKI